MKWINKENVISFVVAVGAGVVAIALVMRVLPPKARKFITGV